jgi:hypothetical protein
MHVLQAASGVPLRRSKWEQNNPQERCNPLSAACKIDCAVHSLDPLQRTTYKQDIKHLLDIHKLAALKCRWARAWMQGLATHGEQCEDSTK